MVSKCGSNDSNRSGSCNGKRICWPPYRFAQLLTPKLEAVSQGEFDKAVVYIDKLKSLSTKYVQEYIGSYKIDFSSTDGVNARLNELKKGKGLLDGREFAVQSTSQYQTTTV